MFMLGLGVILAIGLALFSFVDRKSVKAEVMAEVREALTKDDDGTIKRFEMLENNVVLSLDDAEEHIKKIEKRMDIVEGRIDILVRPRSVPKDVSRHRKRRELLEAFEDQIVANILRVVTGEPLLKEPDVRVRLHSEAVAKPQSIIDLCELMKKRGEL